MGKIIGGISNNGIIYCREMKTLKVRGWFLPRKEYDSIEVYYNNELIGKAELDLERKDVIRNFPQFKGDKPGFSFSSTNIKYNNGDDYILLLIKYKEIVIDCRIEKIEVRSYEQKLLNLLKRYSDVNISKICGGKESFLLIDENSDIDVLRTCINKDEMSLITENMIDNWFISGQSFIVVASCEWDKVCRRLEKRGYIAFKDFLPLWYIPVIQAHYVEVRYLDILSVEIEEYVKFIRRTKKVLIVFGNCQAEKISRGLVCSDLINKKYNSIILPGIHEFEEREIKILRRILRYTDLFIYQNIKMDNKFSPLLGTKYMNTILSEKCRKICIPNIYFSAYYPQQCNNRYDKSGLFAVGDININALYEKKQLTKSNIDRLNDEKYYSENEVQRFLTRSFEELKKRENEYCDIKISDYLENNYRKSLLFYVSNHPRGGVFVEVIQRILEFLYGERDSNYQWNNEIGELDTIALPIYNSVAKYLKLEFDGSRFVPHKNYSLDIMDWDKYYNEYVEMCFGIKELS